MATINSYHRLHNGILIYIPAEQWPTDLPLPPDSQLASNSEGQLSPCRRFVLESEQTIEIFVGQFDIPLSVQQAWDWYQTHMVAQGWLEQDNRQTLPVLARLKYDYPLPADDAVTRLTSEISLQQLATPSRTRVILRRTAITPQSIDEPS